MSDNEHISVITVVKDDHDGLLRTVESLQTQSYKNWELIIVGTSENDKTGNLARRLSNEKSNVNFLVREPRGIYDAMNYGASYAQGDFLWFMNAGDIFANKNAIGIAVDSASKNKIDLLIGNHVFKGESKPRRNQKRPRYINSFGFAFSLRISHQAMIFRKEQFDAHLGYNTRYRYVADSELVLRIMKGRNTFLIPDILAVVETGGFSDTNLPQLYREKHDVRKKYFNIPVISLISLIWNKIATLKNMLI